MNAPRAILLVAHGSTSIAEAGTAVAAQAERLRASGGFAAVEPGLLNGSPSVLEAVGRLPRGPITVVPFFMGDGYFTRVLVPNAVNAAAENLGLERSFIGYTQPVGGFAGAEEIIITCAQSACERHGLAAQDAAVVVVGHGHAKSRASSEILRAHVARLATRGTFAALDVAFLEEAPLVADMLARHENRPTIVLGFFAGAGKHPLEDMPEAMADERMRRGARGAVVIDGGSVGAHPAFAAVIIDALKG